MKTKELVLVLPSTAALNHVEFPFNKLALRDALEKYLEIVDGAGYHQMGLYPSKDYYKEKIEGSAVAYCTTELYDALRGKIKSTASEIVTTDTVNVEISKDTYDKISGKEFAVHLRGLGKITKNGDSKEFAFSRIVSIDIVLNN